MTKKFKVVLYRKFKKIIVAFNSILNLWNGIIHILVPIIGSAKIVYTAISTFNKIFIYSGVAIKIISIKATKNEARAQVRREWKRQEDGG